MEKGIVLVLILFTSSLSRAIECQGPFAKNMCNMQDDLDCLAGSDDAHSCDDQLTTVHRLKDEWKKASDFLSTDQSDPKHQPQVNEVRLKMDKAVSALVSAVEKKDRAATAAALKDVKDLEEVGHRVKCVNESCRLMISMEGNLRCIRGDEPGYCNKTISATQLISGLKQSRDLVIAEQSGDATKIKSVTEAYDALDKAAQALKAALDAEDDEAVHAALHTIDQWKNQGHEEFLPDAAILGKRDAKKSPKRAVSGKPSEPSR